MSSMKVKSRIMSPWLKTLMVSPFEMALAKSIGAMSGRPHGPYTVKYRRPVIAMP